MGPCASQAAVRPRVEWPQRHLGSVVPRSCQMRGWGHDKRFFYVLRYINIGGGGKEGRLGQWDDGVERVSYVPWYSLELVWDHRNVFYFHLGVFPSCSDLTIQISACSCPGRNGILDWRCQLPWVVAGMSGRIMCAPVLLPSKLLREGRFSWFFTRMLAVWYLPWWFLLGTLHSSPWKLSLSTIAQACKSLGMQLPVSHAVWFLPAAILVIDSDLRQSPGFPERCTVAAFLFPKQLLSPSCSRQLCIRT